MLPTESWHRVKDFAQPAWLQLSVLEQQVQLSCPITDTIVKPAQCDIQALNLLAQWAALKPKDRQSRRYMPSLDLITPTNIG